MTYSIADEPVETPWRNFVVSPAGPLLAEMMCGSWLAIPWFAANAFALGSPTLKKELGMCAAAFAVTAVLATALVWAVDRDVIEGTTAIRLCVLAIVSWKLFIAYAINIVQGRTFHVYEYYGGPVRQATAVIVTGYLMRGFVLDLFDNPVWKIIVSGDVQ
jgi:hypothetical protein